MRRNIWKKKAKGIARRRIYRLFALAEKMALKGRMDLADRYVLLARKLSMHYLVPISRRYKRQFCKHCYRFLLPSVSSRVRFRKHKVIIWCSYCNKFTRIPFIREVKQRRQRRDDRRVSSSR